MSIDMILTRCSQDIAKILELQIYCQYIAKILSRYFLDISKMMPR